MKIKGTQKLPILFVFSILALTLSACSDDKPATSGAQNNASKAAVVKKHHFDPGEASVSIKQKFETEFAKKCVSRELKNSVNKDIDEKRYTEDCNCIAKHISDHLADVDAEKYLMDHEDTQAVDIKFDTAAYFCLQSKPQPKGPHLFGR